MDRYPLLEFNLKKLYHNTEIVTKLCENYGIKVAGIIKGFGGIPEGAEEMAKGGCYQIDVYKRQLLGGRVPGGPIICRMEKKSRHDNL